MYTLLTLIPTYYAFGSFYIHSAYLAIVFLISVWNGANFYFEIFTETYSKRLKKTIKEIENNKEIVKQDESTMTITRTVGTMSTETSLPAERKKLE